MPKGYSEHWSERITADDKDYIRKLISSRQSNFDGISPTQLEQYEITRKNTQSAKTEQENKIGFDSFY